MQGRELKPLLPRAFVPLMAPRAFKGAKGGRGGAKSHHFAGQLVAACYSDHTRAACLREVQHSIKDSVKQLVEDKIATFGMSCAFRITEREITCPRTDSLIIFRGLQNHTAASIKSLEGFNRALYEESQTLTQRSLDLAIPTFRAPGTEQWFAWNPNEPTDPVDKLFRENASDPDFACIEVNYEDNPWFPENLRRQMERDKLRDYDRYLHIWRGQYRRNSDAQVFRNWKIERFAPPDGVMFYLGADWGFSIDPTVLVLCYIVGRTLYVWREVWALGCEIDRTPALFDKIDPTWTAQNAVSPTWKSLARRHQITADSARPETISYMQRNGYPRIQPAVKGAGSVEDGIEFLKSYDIVVHPDCTHVADELRMFSYKVNPKTDEITNVLGEKKNHTIDSLRYAVESVRRRVTSSSEALNL